MLGGKGLTPASLQDYGKCGDLVVSVRDSRSRGLGSRPVPSNCVVFLKKHFTLTVLLSTQEYKWVQQS